MPDAWEVTVGLDPNVADNNGDFDNDGYTNLEEYLNDIAAFPASTPIAWGGSDGRYALITNWNPTWQPSRYDTAQINLGTATVDAMGQAAGTVSVGTLGTLNITAGRLDVSADITVLGKLNWSGGQLGTSAASNLTVGNGTNAASVSLSAGRNKTLRVHNLTVNALAKIDLADNAMSWISGSIRRFVIAVRPVSHPGSWTGNGITSSSAATLQRMD
jgi:hypothetical protein